MNWQVKNVLVFIQFFLLLFLTSCKNEVDLALIRKNMATTTTSTGDPTTFITIWKTDNPGTSAANQVTLPLINGGNYNFVVNWGDGQSNTITAWNSADKTHTYSSIGTYTVTMTGTFSIFGYQVAGDPRKLIDVAQWGTNQWSTMLKMFSGCTNLQMTATDAPDLSNVLTMAYMFNGATIFNGSIGHWNVSNVTSMSNMFVLAQAFNKDISNWNVGNVTTMSQMFFRAFAFNQNLNAWNVSNVVDMGRMFNQASAFNGAIGNWNVGNVASMNAMFSLASNFNQDISSWNVGNVTDMSGILNSASVFNQDLSLWNVASVTNSINYDSGATAWIPANKPASF